MRDLPDCGHFFTAEHQLVAVVSHRPGATVWRLHVLIGSLTDALRSNKSSLLELVENGAGRQFAREVHGSKVFNGIGCAETGLKWNGAWLFFLICYSILHNMQAESCPYC
jgi:hypothetical protein